MNWRHLSAVLVVSLSLRLRPPMLRCASSFVPARSPTAPGAHDYPRFLAEWVPLLNARGAKATGANTFPTAQQLAETDVLILHAQEAGNIPDATDRRTSTTSSRAAAARRDSRRRRVA
jgi:hypothetical protein